MMCKLLCAEAISLKLGSPKKGDHQPFNYGAVGKIGISAPRRSNADEGKKILLPVSASGLSMKLTG